MDSLAIFIIASAALIVTPGPDIIYVFTRGIAEGKWSGVLSALGVTAGILIHTVAAVLGLAVLLKTSVYAFWALKIAGGVYLAYLGFQMIRDRSAFEVSVPDGQRMDMKKCFLRGFLSNVMNPKVALFFVAFLPQFISAESGNRELAMMALGVIFAGMSAVVFVTLGIFAGRAGAWLRKRERAAGGIRIGSGIALLLLGVRLLMPQRS